MVNALNKKKWPGPIQISFNMSAGDLLNEALGGGHCTPTGGDAD
jgi:hypothetical protein